MSDSFNDIAAEVGATMYQLLQDKHFLEQAEAREKQIREELELSRLVEQLQKERDTAVAEREDIKAETTAATAKLKAAIKRLQELDSEEKLCV